MDLFLYPIVRAILYIFAVGTVALFGVSVHRERKRMRNCVLLVLSLFLIWESAVIISGYVFGKDITGPVVIPLLILTLLFASGLIINGCVVIKKEGLSVAHSLSIIAGTAVIIGIAVYIGIVLYSLHMGQVNNKFYNLPLIAEIGLYICMELAAYLPLMEMGFLLYSFVYQKLPIKARADYIVVLGCGLSGKQVTPLLASRLDKAIQFDKKNNCNSIFLVSGGKGDDEEISEAQAMENYLTEQGIPLNRILKEDRSTTTNENLMFSKKIMEQRSNNYFCVISTNNFHVLRAAIFAQSSGLNGEVIGCKTASYYHPVAVIREHIALLLSYKGIFFIYVALVLAINIIHYI